MSHAVAGETPRTQAVRRSLLCTRAATGRPRLRQCANVRYLGDLTCTVQICAGIRKCPYADGGGGGGGGFF